MYASKAEGSLSAKDSCERGSWLSAELWLTLKKLMNLSSEQV